MKAFETPKLWITAFAMEDVITSSSLTDPTEETIDPLDPTSGDVGTDIL